MFCDLNNRVKKIVRYMKGKENRSSDMKSIKPNEIKLENIWKYKELRKNIINTIIAALIIGIIIGIIISIPFSNIMNEEDTSIPIYQRYEKFTGAETFVYKDTSLRNSAWDGAETPDELYLRIRDYYQDEMSSDQLKWFDYMLHNVVK
jgi:hypothetical protein